MWWHRLQCEKTVLSIPQGDCFSDVPKLSADIIHVTECAPMDLGVYLNVGSKQYSQTLWGKGECKWRMRMKGGKGEKKGMVLLKENSDAVFCYTRGTAGFILQQRKLKIRTSWNNAVFCWSYIWRRNNDATVYLGFPMTPKQCSYCILILCVSYCPVG